MISVQVSQPHKLFSRVVHFVVWIYINAVPMVRVTSISYRNERKMRLGVGGSMNFAYRGRDLELHVHDTKPYIHKLCKRHRLVLLRFPDSESSIFLQWPGCGLRAIVGATPTRQPRVGRPTFLTSQLLHIFGMHWAPKPLMHIHR